MALIKCKECGKEVSNNALSCPNCGNPIKSNNKSGRFGCSTLFVIGIILVGLAWLVGNETINKYSLNSGSTNKTVYRTPYPTPVDQKLYIPQSGSTFKVDKYIKEHPDKKILIAKKEAIACMSTGLIEKMRNCAQIDLLKCKAEDFIDGKYCFYVREGTKVVVIDKDPENSALLWVRIDGLDYPIWTVRPALQKP